MINTILQSSQSVCPLQGPRFLSLVKLIMPASSFPLENSEGSSSVSQNQNLKCLDFQMTTAFLKLRSQTKIGYHPLVFFRKEFMSVTMPGVEFGLFIGLLNDMTLWGTGEYIIFFWGRLPNEHLCSKYFLSTVSCARVKRLKEVLPSGEEIAKHIDN